MNRIETLVIERGFGIIFAQSSTWNICYAIEK